MSQKSTTTTTSFIISSDESLNKPPLSSSQSTGSSDCNLAATGLNQNSQYFVSLDPIDNNNMVLNQQTRLQAPSAMQQPPYPQPSITQGLIYKQPAIANIDASSRMGNSFPISAQNQQPPCPGRQPSGIQSNTDFCDGATVPTSGSTSMIYGIYNQNNNNSSLNSGGDPSSIQFRQPDASYAKCNDALNHQPNSASTVIQNQPNSNEISHPQHNNNSTHPQNIRNGQYSPKSNASTQSFQQQNNKKLANSQRASVVNLEYSSSNTLMPINVKSMILHGVANHEVIRAWLKSIKCEEYVKNFIDNGYDMALLSRMTPQDLTAIGCKSPALRKKLLLEIKKLNIDDDIPNSRPHSLEQWLELLKLSEYRSLLSSEGYDSIDKICELTWEDLEEIGIVKLGHQKRLLLGIERVLKFDKLQEEHQAETIYDVHPNHRISLHQSFSDINNRLSTLGRSTVRSGFFQTRSGANLDHRGLPVATVVPALKHINSSLASLDISHPQMISTTKDGSTRISNSNGSNDTVRLQSQDLSDRNSPQLFYGANNIQLENGLKMSDLSTTMRRNPPPLPPVRTNSLKMPQDSSFGQKNDTSNSIYGNGCTISNMNGCNNTIGNFMPIASSQHTGSTSFLRTPKLGTLTATTTKMLTSGGHIQSINGHPTNNTTMYRSVAPIREAPLPPIPSQPPRQIIRQKIIEESSHPTSQMLTAINFSNHACGNIGGTSLINSSLIGHQLASADEFPPPPPSST